MEERAARIAESHALHWWIRGQRNNVQLVLLHSRAPLPFRAILTLCLRYFVVKTMAPKPRRDSPLNILHPWSIPVPGKPGCESLYRANLPGFHLKSSYKVKWFSGCWYMFGIYRAHLGLGCTLLMLTAALGGRAITVCADRWGRASTEYSGTELDFRLGLVQSWVCVSDHDVQMWWNSRFVVTEGFFSNSQKLPCLPRKSRLYCLDTPCP